MGCGDPSNCNNSVGRFCVAKSHSCDPRNVCERTNSLLREIYKLYLAVLADVKSGFVHGCGME